MTEPIVGILGGMGPAAAAAFYARLVELTPARRDQEHLRVVMWSDPTVPDRTAAFLHGGESVTPWLEQGVDRLVGAGATVLVSPCNTAHVWLPDIARRAGVELLSIIEATTGVLAREVAPGAGVGILGTDATIASGLYQDGLMARGLQPVLPDPGQQARLVRALYAVKRGGGDAREEAAELVGDVGRSLTEQGAKAILNGCTEISLVLDRLELPVTDCSDALARAVVARSGRVLAA